ncbi:MAG: hypothetical protein QOJ30_4894 [Pseudonocardiales bacterium]|nr:hypothetical protein [Pseudonocardiales bacterium]
MLAPARASRKTSRNRARSARHVPGIRTQSSSPVHSRCRAPRRPRPGTSATRRASCWPGATSSARSFGPRWHHVVRDVEQTADHRSAIVAEPAAADTQDRQQDEWQHAPGIPAHPDGDLVQNVVAELRARFAEAGRDPAGLEVQLEGPAPAEAGGMPDPGAHLDELDRYAKAGVTSVFVHIPPDGGEAALDALRSYGAQVVAPNRTAGH